MSCAACHGADGADSPAKRTRQHVTPAPHRKFSTHPTSPPCQALSHNSPSPRAPRRQDFVFAREALQRGRYLDPLLAAAPPTTLSIAADQLQPPTQAQHGPLQPQHGPLQPSPQHRLQQHRPQQRPQQEQQQQAVSPDEALGGPGLFLHVLPAGQPGSALPGALMRVAQRLAQQAEAEAETLLPAAAAAGQAPRRGRGALLRGRGAGRRLAMAEAAAAGAGPPRYLCVVSDGEELDQVCVCVCVGVRVHVRVRGIHGWP